MIAVFFFTSIRRLTSCELVTRVQTCSSDLGQPTLTIGLPEPARAVRFEFGDEPAGEAAFILVHGAFVGDPVIERGEALRDEPEAREPAEREQRRDARDGKSAEE